MLGSYKNHLKKEAEKYMEKLFGFKIPVDDVLTYHEGCGGEHYRIRIDTQQSVKTVNKIMENVYKWLKGQNNEIILEVEFTNKNEPEGKIRRIVAYNDNKDIIIWKVYDC